MGCCASTARSSDPESPYVSPNIQADSSSRAITSAPAPHAEVSTRRTSTLPAASLSSQPQTIGLAEQFNQPLRPHVWTSKRQWTRAELDLEREEFFDTRVTGHPEIWGTLKMVVELLGEGEVETAQGVLDAAGVTVPTGDLTNGAYDETGNFYHMPEHVIADPENMLEEIVRDGLDKDEEANMDDEELERRREEKGKSVLKSGDLIKVKARLSDRGGPDIIIMFSKEANVRVLIRKVQEKAGMIEKGRVKIAYLGKILKEGETLLAQGWREGHVVNALVFQ